MKTRLTPAAKRLVKFLIVALVVHIFVIPQLGGARKALSVLGSVNPLLLVAAVALEALALGTYAWLTMLLLPAEERPVFGVIFGTVLASTGVNHVVPGGAATTAAVNYRLLGRAGVSPNALGFALGTQAIGSAVVLNVILWMALVISIPTTGFQPVYATAAGVGAVLIALVAVAVISLRRGREGFTDKVTALAEAVPGLRPERIRPALLGAADQLDLLLRDRRRLRVVIVLAAFNWLLDAAALWVALSAFGAPPGIDGLLVAYGLANVIAAIPISPGGLGVVEAILIPTLVAFGTPTAEASIGVVAYRLINFWLPIPVGALCYLLVERATSAKRRMGFRGALNWSAERRNKSSVT